MSMTHTNKVPDKQPQQIPVFQRGHLLYFCQCVGSLPGSREKEDQFLQYENHLKKGMSIQHFFQEGTPERRILKIYFISQFAIVFSLMGVLQDKSVLSINCRLKSIDRCIVNSLLFSLKTQRNYTSTLESLLRFSKTCFIIPHKRTKLVLPQQKHIRPDHDSQNVYHVELCHFNLTTAK